MPPLLSTDLMLTLAIPLAHLAFLTGVPADAFEVAMPGREGLDDASAAKNYRLRALPGEAFSGLELMCLMHAGCKRLAPGDDTGMNLDEPFLAALELFQNGEGRR